MQDVDKKRTSTRIRVADAIRKTTQWRKFIKKAFPKRPEATLPKAVYISREDIEQLGELCRGKNFDGVRAYFTLEHDCEQELHHNTVKFVMVPVKKAEGYRNGQDCPFTGPDSSDANNLDDSNVFDFTRPCPDSCDETSILFSGTGT